MGNKIVFFLKWGVMSAWLRVVSVSSRGISGAIDPLNGTGMFVFVAGSQRGGAHRSRQHCAATGATTERGKLVI